MQLDAQERRLADRAAAMPMRTWTEQWAAVSSGTSNAAGLAAMAAMLAGAFSTLPGAIELAEPAPVSVIRDDGSEAPVTHGRHLVLRVRPGAPRRVLLTGHMDTVFAADHPFRTVRESEPGVLNGPGVADMKGGLAIMLGALSALEQDGTTLGYDVLVNSDEETGSTSSAALIRALAADKVAALTYEPALAPDGTLAGARPGSGNIAFIVTGRAAHAGRNPEDGRNALLAAAALAVRLAALNGPGLLVNPARIAGGGPNNVVPDHAVLHVNIRPATAADEARAKSAIDAARAAIAREHEVAIRSHGGFGRPPKPIDAGADALFGLVGDAGRALGQTIPRRPSGGVCDGNNIAACGVPVIDTMGARGGAIHSPGEYLILASLAERAALSAIVLHRIAGAP